MAQINAGYTRRTELRCTLEELTTYGAVILYEGESIYVKQGDGRYAVKIGDGKTPLTDLPYVVNYSEMNGVRQAAEEARLLAESAEGAAREARLGAEAAVASLDIGLSVVDGELCITFEEEA